MYYQGMHQVFRMDSNLGGMIGFFVFLFTTVIGLMALWFCVSYRDFRGREARIGKICAGILASYIAVAMLVAVLTPRTIVNPGDGYCWDVWCVGMERVSTEPQGKDVLYTLRVQLFSDADHVSNSQPKNFLSAVDDQGRRFRVFQNADVAPLDVTVAPKETVETSLSFVAPANAKKIYLTGEQVSMPWVYLYFGSDLNPLHPKTLLRVL
jgi:hypothetical protein